MRLLLDTHIFLWLISGDARLSNETKAKILDAENTAYLSVVSIWETIVKYQLGNLSLPQLPSEYLPKQRERHQIESLRLDEISVSRLVALPSIHRDPFDRMLICQALAHDCTFVTVDEAIMRYPVKIMR